MTDTRLPGDVPLFDLPAVAPPSNPKTPMVVPASYAAALERAGGQCEQKRPRSRNAEPERCFHVIAHYRLFLCEDGVLRCEACAKWVEAQAKPKPVRKRAKR